MAVDVEYSGSVPRPESPAFPGDNLEENRRTTPARRRTGDRAQSPRTKADFGSQFPPRSSPTIRCSDGRKLPSRYGFRESPQNGSRDRRAWTESDRGRPRSEEHTSELQSRFGI